MVSSIVVQRLADIYGRKWPFWISLAVGLATHVAIVLSRDLTTTIALFFLFGACNAGRYAICYVYMCELMPPQYRDYVGAFTQFSDSSTFIVFVVYYRFVSKDWLPFQLFAMFLTLVCVITTFFIPESPKYLYEKGHYKKARDTLYFIRRCNLRGNERQAFRFDGEATRDFTKAVEIYEEAKQV